MTNYETATFIIRKGSDDYTLWVIDLLPYELSRLRRRDLSIRGDMDHLLEQIPFECGMSRNNQRPYLLMPNRSQFTLYTLAAPYSFLREHSGSGFSSRGDKETILCEFAEVHGIALN